MASIGLGSVLRIGPSTTDITSVGAIRNIDGPSVSADVAVSATLDTASWKGKYKGLADAGDITFTIEYSSTLASHKVIGTALASNAEWYGAIYVVDSTATPEEFQGYITGFSRSISVDDLITADVTWTYNGDPALPTS